MDLDSIADLQKIPVLLRDAATRRPTSRASSGATSGSSCAGRGNYNRWPRHTENRLTCVTTGAQSRERRPEAVRAREIVFILLPHGFVAVPVDVMKEYCGGSKSPRPVVDGTGGRPREIVFVFQQGAMNTRRLAYLCGCPGITRRTTRSRVGQLRDAAPMQTSIFRPPTVTNSTGLGMNANDHPIFYSEATRTARAHCRRRSGSEWTDEEGRDGRGECVVTHSNRSPFREPNTLLQTCQSRRAPHSSVV